MSTIRRPFSSQHSTSNFSSVPIAFHRFFTWVALGDADLLFLQKLVIKANAVKGETI
jgi:hypothetical protein